MGNTQGITRDEAVQGLVSAYTLKYDIAARNSKSWVMIGKRIASYIEALNKFDENLPVEVLHSIFDPMNAPDVLPPEYYEPGLFTYNVLSGYIGFDYNIQSDRIKSIPDDFFDDLLDIVYHLRAFANEWETREYSDEWVELVDTMFNRVAPQTGVELLQHIYAYERVDAKDVIIWINTIYFKFGNTFVVAQVLKIAGEQRSRRIMNISPRYSPEKKELYLNLIQKARQMQYISTREWEEIGEEFSLYLVCDEEN